MQPDQHSQSTYKTIQPTNVVRIMRDVREEEAAHEGEEEAKEKESSGGEHAADGRAVTSVFTMYSSTSIYQVIIP